MEPHSVGDHAVADGLVEAVEPEHLAAQGAEIAGGVAFAAAHVEHRAHAFALDGPRP